MARRISCNRFILYYYYVGIWLIPYLVTKNPKKKKQFIFAYYHLQNKEGSVKSLSMASTKTTPFQTHGPEVRCRFMSLFFSTDLVSYSGMHQMVQSLISDTWAWAARGSGLFPEQLAFPFNLGLDLATPSGSPFEQFGWVVKT